MDAGWRRAGLGSTTGDAFFEHGEVALRYRLEGEGPLVTLNHGVGLVSRQLGRRCRAARRRVPRCSATTCVDTVSRPRCRGRIGSMISSPTTSLCSTISASPAPTSSASRSVEWSRKPSPSVNPSGSTSSSSSPRSPAARPRSVARSGSGPRTWPRATSWHMPRKRRPSVGSRTSSGQSIRRSSKPASRAAWRQTAKATLPHTACLPRMISSTNYRTSATRLWSPRASTIRRARRASRGLWPSVFRTHGSAFFPGLRHGLLLEAPDQVAAVLRDFLVGGPIAA